MNCIKCYQEIPDGAKFCPYCGSKTEPPHNSAETNSRTAYEPTANTNAEQLTVQNKQNSEQLTVQKQQNAETAYGTKTSKTPETDRETFKTNTEDRFKQHQQAT